MLRNVGSLVKEFGVVFTNLIGVLSGDSAIEGTTFNLEKMARAIEHLSIWLIGE